MAAQLLAINDAINGIVWGPPFMLLLVGTGLYLTIRIRFFRFIHLGYAWRHTFGRALRRTREGAGAITPVQAVASAMAATIGVGNIAGVSTAIALGGPGAVFWMWLVALVRDGDEVRRGDARPEVPPHRRAPPVVGGHVLLHRERPRRALEVARDPLRSLCRDRGFGIGIMVQANTMAHAMETGFAVPPWMTGVVAVVLVGAATLGGIERIAVTAEMVVPTMAVLYVVACLIILFLHIGEVPAAIERIFADAFTPASVAGGFAGATVWQALRYGIARGIFSNEAGLGSASIAHAQAQNTPVGQGLWGIWEVFIDTIVVCTMTALVILTTGAYATGTTGAELAATAFTVGLPGPGGLLVQIALALFAYTTMLTWNFYGEKSWEYVGGERVIVPYRVIFLGFLFLGAIGALEVIWNIADTLNGLMAAPNLIALLALAGVLAREKDAHLAAAAAPRGNS